MGNTDQWRELRDAFEALSEEQGATDVYAEQRPLSEADSTTPSAVSGGHKAQRSVVQRLIDTACDLLADDNEPLGPREWHWCDVLIAADLVQPTALDVHSQPEGKRFACYRTLLRIDQFVNACLTATRLGAFGKLPRPPRPARAHSATDGDTSKGENARRVKDYKTEVLDGTGQVITDRDIWIAAKYSPDSKCKAFYRWKAGDPVTPGQARKFEPVLNTKPHLRA